MDHRQLTGLVTVVVAATLVGAPVTMADWGQQASFSAEPVDASRVDAETPVLRFEELAPETQRVVRRTVESSDGSYVVYGWEDAPERFAYSDYAEPGYGLYAVVYDGQYYRLTTYAAGGFPFVYWLMELPFVLYGVLLGWLGFRVSLGRQSPRTATTFVGVAVAFHLLGPEFDFPLLSPRGFVVLGLLATLATVAWLLWSREGARVDTDGTEVRRGSR